ncbi:MAG: transglutaminase-like domain-containing protein [Chitinophagaceae bacterium]|nr:transglutaminase-like domain-containing protein [Chitinophagaceae bacterium]
MAEVRRSNIGKAKQAERWVANFAGLLIIIPLTPFICRFIPPILFGGINIDLIISFFIAIIIVRVILWLMRPLIFPALLLVLGYLIYAQMNGTYGFGKVINDYKTLAFSNWQDKDKKSGDLLSINPALFEKPADKVSRRIRGKMQIGDSSVRNWAVKHSLIHFADYQNRYGMLTRQLSLFKHINNNFNYVSDTHRDEYYATPLETIENGMGGDCDDHSILMASALMNIGARCRLVIIEGHMYPELFVGGKKEFDILQQAIVQLFSNEKITNLHFHEYKGEFWINLDYSARHPGGPYLNDKLRLIIDLE